MSMMATMVLCAGYGTRLRPLTDEQPKPLVPVGDRPILAHILAMLAASGVSKVVANTHHRADDLAAWARDSRTPSLPELALVHEPHILGTAGGLAHAAEALGHGPVLVWNGDILAPDLRPHAIMEAFVMARADALWVIAPRSVGEGTVGLDDRGRVVRVRGRSFGTEHAGGDFLGIHVVGSALRERLPEVGCMVGDVALPMLERGGQIATYSFAEPWHDIGDPVGLWNANVAWLGRRGVGTWVAPEAVVAPGIVLSRALVGQGAVVSGVGRIEDCLVLPGARLSAPATRSIAARRATVRF